MPYSYRNCNEHAVAILYDEIITHESDIDGRLSGNNLHTTAMSARDGTDYREQVSGVERVLDRQLTAEGMQLSVLVQKAK